MSIKNKGFITTQFNDFISQELFEKEVIDTTRIKLEEKNVEILDTVPNEVSVLERADEVIENIDNVLAHILNTVESDIGKTADTIRIYMRDMGTKNLLTKDEEIKIAQLIESGSKEVLTALARWTTIIPDLLTRYENAAYTIYIWLYLGFRHLQR